MTRSKLVMFQGAKKKLKIKNLGKFYLVENGKEAYKISKADYSSDPPMDEDTYLKVVEILERKRKKKRRFGGD